jgi:predicted metal-dependent hydrolase
MKAQRTGVDFSGGRRGAVLQPAAGKTRITIRLDTELLDWFREEVNRAGGGNYQTLINDALRQHVEGKRENLEDTLRRVLREELARPRGPRG